MSISNHPRVKEFFARLIIRDKKLQEEIHEELLSHLESSFEEKLGQGLDESEALQQSLHEMGDVAVMAKEFDKVHYPWTRFIVPILTGTSVAALCAGVWMSHAAHNTVVSLQIANETRLAEIHDRFTEDQKILAMSPVFGKQKQTRDAGEFLNNRVSWEYYEPEFRNIEKKNAELTLSDEISEYAKASPEVRKFKSLNPDLSKLDFSWMKELKKYDYWDLYQHGPFSAIFRDHPGKLAHSAPLPNYTQFTVWARLRLMKAEKENDLESAFDELQHLAKLMHTSETLIGSMVSVAILKIARKSYDARKGHQVIAHVPPDEENLESMKRGIWAANSLFQFRYDKTKAIQSLDSLPIGSCAALSESITSWRVMREFLDKEFILEKSFADDVGFINLAIEKSSPECRLTVNRRAWRDQIPLLTDLTEENMKAAMQSFESFIWLFGSKVPFVRQYVASRFMSVAIPNWTSLYDKKKDNL